MTLSHTETLTQDGVAMYASGAPWCRLCMGEKIGMRCKATRWMTYSKNVHNIRPDHAGGEPVLATVPA